MQRKCIEYISASTEEKQLVTDFKKMLSNYLLDIEKEDAFPTLSDTYCCVYNLLETVNEFVNSYFEI